MEQKCGKCANSGSFLSNDGVDAAGEYFQEYEDCQECPPVATISQSPLAAFLEALAAMRVLADVVKDPENPYPHDAVEKAIDRARLARLALDGASKAVRCYGNGR